MPQPSHLHLQRAGDAPFDDVCQMIQGGASALGLSTSTSNHPGEGLNLIVGHNVFVQQKRALPAASTRYNFEQLAPESVWITPAQIGALAAGPVWSYDPVASRRLSAYGVPSKLVRVGYVPEWERLPEVDRDLDVVFFGFPTPYRKAVIAGLAQSGLRVAWPPYTFGPARDALYARAKIGLSLKTYASSVLQSARVGFLLANRRCVVSDPFETPEAYPYAATLAVAPEPGLLDLCHRLAKDPAARKAKEDEQYAAFRAFPYREELERALSAVPEALLRPEELLCHAKDARELRVAHGDGPLPLGVLQFLHDRPAWRIARQEPGALVLERLL